MCLAGLLSSLDGLYCARNGLLVGVDARFGGELEVARVLPTSVHHDGVNARLERCKPEHAVPTFCLQYRRLV